MCRYLSAAAEEVGAKTFFGKEFRDCLKEDHQDTADDLADQMSGVDIENDASPGMQCAPTRAMEPYLWLWAGEPVLAVVVASSLLSR